MDILSIKDLKEKQVDLEYFKSLYEWKSDIFISFEYESNFENTKFLRDYILYLLEIVWVNSIWQRRFVLIIDELNNNSIEYGSIENSINLLTFKSSYNDDEIELKIEVSDNWNWKYPKTADEMEELRNAKLAAWFKDHSSIRWRWLFMIITRLVDKLYFKNRDNWWLIVWVDKKFKKWEDF